MNRYEVIVPTAKKIPQKALLEKSAIFKSFFLKNTFTSTPQYLLIDAAYNFLIIIY